MRRFLLSLLAALVLAPSAHAEPGVHLRWDACAGDGGLSNKTFACDTNTGSEQLLVSFVHDQTLTNVNGVEVVLELQTPANDVPQSWWQLKYSGACRQSALSAVATPGYAIQNCVDPWMGQAAGGVTSYANQTAFNTGYRLQMLFAVPQSLVFDVPAGQETFVGRISISHAKTVGAGACTGCLEPICIGVEQLYVTLSGSPSVPVHLTEVYPGSSSVGWQGGVPGPSTLYHGQIIPRWFRFSSCMAAVPARNGTWGSIKSLYR